MQPLISMAALERSFSRERLAAYRLPSDADEAEGLARYMWNLALTSALLPAMNALEITFRNELNRAAGRLTAGRGYRFHRVRSWLDARPTMLLAHEAEKVERAKDHLGPDPRSQTEGHLVAKLDFGFWVALCRQPYGDARAAGPRLWPRALDYAFRSRPATATTRSDIFHQFDRIRKYRNRVAHHEPIWDRDYEAHHELILQSLAWMAPKLAEAVRTASPALPTYRDGTGAFRPRAEVLLGTGRQSPRRPGGRRSPSPSGTAWRWVRCCCACPPLPRSTPPPSWTHGWRRRGPDVSVRPTLRPP